jgi:tRNA-specific 2-thiouridylase
VRIRHRGALVPAAIHRESRLRAATTAPATTGTAEPARAGGRWVVETDTPVWAAAPGQAAVFYDGERCLGGGRIAHAPAA